MNKQTHLAGYNYQNNVSSYAALTDQAKAALLTCKQAFISQLQIGDLIEGTLIQREDKLFLKELTTGLLFTTSLVDEKLLGQLLEWEVKGMEGEKLLLALKEYLPQASGGDKTIVDQALEELGLPQRPGMKDVVENFTRFELPLLKPSIASTYGLAQVTKLPTQVLLNILQRYQEQVKLSPQVAYKNIDKYEDTKLIESMNEALTVASNALLEKGMSKEQVFTKFFNIFLKVVPGEAFNDLVKELSLWVQPELEGNLEINNKSREAVKSFVKLLVEQEVPVDEALKKCFKSSIRLSLEDLKEATKQLGGLKNTMLFKEDEVIKTLVREIREQMPHKEQLEKAMGQVEEQLMVSQKLKEEGHYYTFPFMSKLGEAHGKVYFYKPHKSKTKKDKSLYTVIALDMPQLKQVEIHIYQVEKSLKIGFYIDELEVRKVIERKAYRLVEPLQALGYHINAISISERIEAKVTMDRVDRQELIGFKGFDYQV